MNTLKPQLRFYQTKLVEDVRSSLARGNTRVIMQSHVGSGKTVIATEIMRLAVEKRKRVLFLAPRRQLIYQTVETLQEYGINAGMIMAGERRFSMPLVQVASFDTITARVGSGRMALPEADLVIVDECFVGSTEISTPLGKKRIDEIQSGDVIYSAIGTDEIASVFSKTVNETLTVRLSNGKKFECTSDHPIFTTKGWVSAGELDKGDCLFSEQDLQELWRECDSNIEIRESDINGTIQQKRVLRYILRQEIQESNARTGFCSEDEGISEVDWSQAEDSRWEWEGINKSSKNWARCASGAMESGVCAKDLQEELGRLSASLQNRFGESCSDDCNRTGWSESCSEGKKESGREKGCFVTSVRVESIETAKHSGGRIVYNLRVRKHPSYFANGSLVHNCHMCVSPARIKVLENYKLVVGLTATPALANGKGMGFFYQDIIESLSMADMVKHGFLVPMRYFIGEAPDLSGVSLNSDGDYVEKQLAEANDTPKLIGDIYSNWKRIASDRTTLVFAVNRRHAVHIHDEFLSHGVASAYIDGDTPKEEREEIRQAVEAGRVQVVINIGVMVAGVNWPRISCVIMARQTRNISTWIQCLGRGSRLHPIKQDCIVIYHGKNFDELGMIDDPIEWSLDDKTTIRERKEKAKKEAKEPKDITCGDCGTVFKARRSCPNCGHEMIAKGEEIPVHQADLQEVAKVKSADKSRFYAELLGYCHKNGKGTSYALAIFKNKFGSWPYGKNSIKPIEPSQEVLNYIKSRQIAYAKRKEVTA